MDLILTLPLCSVDDKTVDLKSSFKISDVKLSYFFFLVLP